MKNKAILFPWKSAVMLAVILILAAALTASVITISKRNKSIEEMGISYSEEQQKLKDANEKIDEMESELSEANSQLEQTQGELQQKTSELEQKENEKKQLEEQVADLQKQIELAKKKKQEQAAAVAAAALSTALPPGDKVCYLTFDDGPSDNTLRILDTLSQYGIKATFFVTCRGTPAYVKNIYDAGHTVALHTATHDYATVYASDEAYFADLQTVSDMVKSYTGIESKIIRFPGGSSNAVSKKYSAGIMSRLTVEVVNRGYNYIDWNVSSGDAESNRVAKEKLVNNVLSQAKNKNSICVLMHDSAAKTTTADALPEIIQGLSAMGFSFDKLSENSYGFHHNVNN